MKAIIIILFSLIGPILVAQNTFFINYARPSYERAFSAVEMQDGSFLLAGEIRQAGYNGVNEGYLVKISPIGEIIQEKFINPQNTARLCLVIPFQYANASFLCIGSSDSLAGDDSFGNKIFYGLDSNLNIIYSKHFGYKYNYTIYPWQYALDNDSVMYLMSDYVRVNANSDIARMIDVVKYKLPLDSIVSYSNEDYSLTMDLLLKNSISKLDLYIFPSNKRITLDENLNYISSSNYPADFLTSICTTPLFDSDYLITGASFRIFSNNLQLGCIKHDYSNNPVDSLFYTPSEDTNFYAGARENTAINGNYIYITGFYNVNAMWFPYNYNPSWVTVTKADLELNMISTHFYGGDAQYCPYSIMPTSDGGCFITGYSYDYINNLPNGNYELDIFALKTDANGLITELPDQPQAKAHDAILYPNPGRENITIQSGPQISGALFTLYDMQGRAVLYRNYYQYTTPA